MAFREPALKPRSGSVVYGPFPLRAAHLALSTLLLLAGLAVAGVAFSRDHLVCTPGARCVMTRSLPSRTTGFPMSSLSDARVDIERTSKGGSYGRVVLVFEGGRELRLQQASPERAAEVATSIRAGLAGQQPIDVTLRGPWWAGLFALGLLAMGLALAYSGAQGRGRFRLEITHGGAGLRVQRRFLAIPVSSRDVSLEGVVDVRVEGGKVREMSLSRGEDPSPAGRIVLVDRSGATRPVTESFFRGQAVHLRAAAELRALLGLDPMPHGVEAQLASLPPVTTPPGTRFAMAWAGVGVGTIAGMALLGLAGLALGVFRMSDPIEVWVVAIGGGGGAIAGVALALYFTRSRPPR